MGRGCNSGNEVSIVGKWCNSANIHWGFAMCKEECWAKSGRRVGIQRLKKMVCVLEVTRIPLGYLLPLLYQSPLHCHHLSHSLHGMLSPIPQENWYHQLKASSTSLSLYAQCLHQISHQGICFVSIYEKTKKQKQKLNAACRLNDKL